MALSSTCAGHRQLQGQASKPVAVYVVTRGVDITLVASKRVTAGLDAADDERLQVMWSCSGKTICLWSADTGAWLGKIGGDRELEETPAASQASFFEGGSGIAHARDAEYGSFSDQQINSAKVQRWVLCCSCLPSCLPGQHTLSAQALGVISSCSNPLLFACTNVNVLPGMSSAH
jgi:hypothetical protein